MHELDVPVIVAIERAAYQFPWSEGIFRDCLRVGYVCRVVDVGGEMAGYGIMSVGSGEAHILNVCIRDEFRGRGFARRILLYLLDRARASGMYEAFLEVRPSNTASARLYHSQPRTLSTLIFLPKLTTSRQFRHWHHPPIILDCAYQNEYQSIRTCLTGAGVNHITS